MLSGQAFILHGSVVEWQSDRQSMRHYAPERSLRTYLAGRSQPFVDPDGDVPGDVLTVDDSTRGGLETCLIARELGHAVTLFVNPSQIISGKDYWFSRFDALVDARSVTSVSFEDVTYDLRSREQLRAFRFAARAHLVVSSEDTAHRLLDEIQLLLRAEGAEVDDHARSISSEDVAQLVAAGVRIGSHGWDHQCISGLSSNEQLAQVVETSDWLRAVTGHEPKDYAVPFGLERLDPKARSAVPGFVYLVDPNLPSEAAGEGYIYRRNLTPMLQSMAQ